MKDLDEEGATNTGTNLFVTGIHPRLKEEDVIALFDKYGEVESCSIMLDPHTKESRGFGFVKMVTPDQADAAKEGLQGAQIEGRTLSIEKARRGRPRTPTPGKYFGPPKRGKCHYHVFLAMANMSQVTLAAADVAHQAVTGIGMTIVVVAMVDVTTTEVVPLEGTTTTMKDEATEVVVVAVVVDVNETTAMVVVDLVILTDMKAADATTMEPAVSDEVEATMIEMKTATEATPARQQPVKSLHESHTVVVESIHAKTDMLGDKCLHHLR